MEEGRGGLLRWEGEEEGDWDRWEKRSVAGRDGGRGG